jgi:hypothetical protein
MATDFIEAMTKRSDSELLEIVTRLRNDYQGNKACFLSNIEMMTT